MKHLQMRIFSIALFLCLCTTAFAQPNIGEKVGEFQLQATRWQVLRRQPFD